MSKIIINYPEVAILGVGKTRIPITSRTTFKPDDINFYGSGITKTVAKSVLSYDELFNDNISY